MSKLSIPTGVDYAEMREHEVRKARKVMVDGNLTANVETSEGGVSARVFNGGYWGFASIPAMDPASRDKVVSKAVDNAAARRISNWPATPIRASRRARAVRRCPSAKAWSSWKPLTRTVRPVSRSLPPRA